MRNCGQRGANSARPKSATKHVFRSSAPDDETHVSERPDALVAVTERTCDHRLRGAEQRIVGERSPGQIGVVFRDERQNALARHELAGNRVSYRGHPTGEADALVHGLQPWEA